MVQHVSPEHVSALRRFSRFFTNRIGVLEETLLGSGFTLTEARIMFEVGSSGKSTAAALATHLNLNPGYLSRVLKSLVKRGFIARQASVKDARQVSLQLTAVGRAAFADLDAASQRAMAALLAPLSLQKRAAAVAAMGVIERELAADAALPPPAVRGPVSLRPLKPGDIGWVVHRHGVLYSEEFGWDASFEALVAKIAGAFVDAFDAARANAWVAECDGRVVGSAFVVPQSKYVAKLRLVYVEPDMRGAGVGLALVEAALAFARERGYRRMTLWTNDVLVAARRLYERLGFKLTASKPYHGFGKDLVSETWVIELESG